MSNTHEWVNTQIKPFKEKLQNIPQDLLPYFFATMNKKHVFNVPDVKMLPSAAAAEKAEFESEGIKSVLCIGLRSENALFGFIGCDCVTHIRHWTDTDLMRIKLVGEIITNEFNAHQIGVGPVAYMCYAITANKPEQSIF